MTIFIVLAGVALLAGFGAKQFARHRSRQGLVLRMQALSARADDGRGLAIGRQADDGQSLLGRIVLAVPGIETVERWLVRAGGEQTLTRFAARVLQVAAGVGALAGLASGSVAFGLLGAGAGGVVVVAHLRLRGEKRRGEFEAQLPEALDFIGRALRAGHGLTMAIGMVGDELPAPIGPEFRTVFDEINFGVPFDDALANLSGRVVSMDLNFFVIATRIHRETGGNFTEIIGSISSTIRERMKLQGKVRVLSSEGRFSGVLLGVLPFLIGGLMTLVNPEYMSELWFSEKGQNLVGIGLVLIVLGFAWMWHIARIRV